MELLEQARLQYRYFMDPDYLDYKFESYRKFARFVTALCIPFLMVMWLWDLAVDFQSSFDTLELRFGMSVCGILGWMALDPRRSKTVFKITLPIMVSVIEILFLLNLHVMQDGAIYGLGGFLYFYLFVPFLALPYSFRFNMFCLIIIPVLPILAVSMGIGFQLNMAVYNVYVWMAYGAILLIVLMLEHQNRKLYDYRKQIEKLATKDGLTEVLNWRHLLESCANLITFARQCKKEISFLMMDIDFFKQVNDTYGHQAGDQVIKAVVNQSVRVIRRSDVLGRYGGEEFFIALPDAGAEQAMRVAERIRLSIAKSPIRVSFDQEVSVTVSIGICTLTPDTLESYDLQACIQEADQALYEAKKTGRNRTVARAENQVPTTVLPEIASQSSNAN